MPKTTATHTITTNPALSTEWERLREKIAGVSLIFNRTDNDTMRDRASAHLDELKQQQADLEARIAEAARILTLENLPPRDYAALIASHPPRPDDPFDRQMGFNTDTFDRPLIDGSITTVTDGTGVPITGFTWAEVADDIPFGQFQEIVTSALALNMNASAVPFSLADWASRQPSAPR